MSTEHSGTSGHLRESNAAARRRQKLEDLDKRLLAGLRSPTSEMTAEDWSALRERILAGNSELRG